MIALAVVAALAICAVAVYRHAMRSPVMDDLWPQFTPTDVIDARELVPLYLDATVQEAAEAAAIVRGIR